MVTMVERPLKPLGAILAHYVKEDDLMAADLIPLPRLPRELSIFTGGPPPTYRQCYKAALDARIETTLVNGRHHAYRTHLRRIARVLGLSGPPIPVSETPPRRRGTD
jgi:hypothetical protein